MKNILLPLFLISSLFFCSSIEVEAQDGSSLPTPREEKENKKVRFNGLGRTILQQTALDGEVMETDPEAVDKLTDGEFLLDLRMNATPNDKTEVQAILRLRNEFGGFFGAGQSIEIRELWARGIIGNVLNYRVGDMDHVMTPYTLFNPDEEGMVNQPALFGPQKEVLYYEQFYAPGNKRRLQGAKLDFGLNFTQLLQEANFSGFIARIRATDFFTLPTRFIGGGNIDLVSKTFNDSLGLKAKLGLNLVHTWDDLNIGEITSGIQNTVYTVTFDLTLMDKKNLAIHLLGEAGRSDLKFQIDTVNVDEEDDTFVEVGAEFHFKKQNLKLAASYVDVGPDFFSIGAQSKRIDFERDKTYFNRIGKDDIVRMPSFFDITRDRALYNFQLSDRLMSYDPRLSNTMPYGKATPNRQGLRFGIDYEPANEKIEANITGAFMKEIRGQGTFELKSFNLIRAMANFNFHKMASWDKKLRLTLGYQYETTSRGGQEIEQLDLSSNLLEAGLEVELFSKFELLLGGIFLTAEGRDYVPLIREFNDVRDFPAPFVADDSETLIGAGLKYNFKEGIYLTLQYQRFDFSRATDPTNDYGLNQLFVLYNMNF